MTAFFWFGRGGRFGGSWFGGYWFGCKDEDAGLLAEDGDGRADELAAVLLFAEDARMDELATALLCTDDAPPDELVTVLLCPEADGTEFPEADETKDTGVADELEAPEGDPDADEEGMGNGKENADEETKTIEPEDTLDTGGGKAEEEPEGKYDISDGRAVEVAVIGVSVNE
ncbi:hypothetical protein C8R44DRAFT_728581 [Mycena epipterygia]|nr:hypothetical protein C8R44DRAFT_728581 [Mycena epipterygia]